jgi:hypothetical protein
MALCSPSATQGPQAELVLNSKAFPFAIIQQEFESSRASYAPCCAHWSGRRDGVLHFKLYAIRTAHILTVNT